SQSSSRSLQTSGIGPTAPTQVSDPETHASVPLLHSPVSMPQLAPPSGSPSSTMPSQSLSRPSQRSGLGPVSPMQTRAPPMQVSTPSSHSPSSVAPQLPPPPGLPSSISPSQSS